MMFCRSALNTAPAAGHVSSDKVSTMVDVPARMSSSLSFVTVPLSATEAPTVVTLNVGAATIATPAWASALAGTVAVMVSRAVMS